MQPCHNRAVAHLSFITYFLPIVISNLPVISSLQFKQECIPVGCVPPAHWPYLVVSARGACVARISTSQTLFAGGKNRLCNFQYDKLFCMLQPALMIVCDVIMRHVLSVWREKHGMAACALVRFRSCLWIELLIFKFREKNGGSCFEGHLYSVGEGVKRGRRMSLKTNMNYLILRFHRHIIQ